jgi:5-methylthioadenosine/S-adenosylhomocysteine deaminase
MARDGEQLRADVLLRDGVIAEINDDSADVPNDTEVLDASEAFVLPGFIQTHVHVVQSLLRHQADGLELLDWLKNRTWPYEASLDGDATEAAAELGIAELLSGGTTTALDFGTVHHQQRVFEAAQRTGIRMISGKTHMNIGEGVPQKLIEDEERSVAEAEALGRRWHGRENRLGYVVSPRFALSCSQPLLQQCATLARKHGWLLQTHASENRGEVAEVRKLTGKTNIGYLDAVGLTGSDVVLAHCVHLDDSEVDVLARTGTRVSHCPGANLKLGSGVADVPKLLRSDICVSLGADGAPCNNRLSIFHEMALAGTLHSLRSGTTAISPWQILAMATREAARALGKPDIGTIEKGKRADVVVVSLEDWACQPGGDPASRIVYGATAQSVRHVVVDGRVLVKDSSLCCISSDQLREKVHEAWRATHSRMKEVA